MMNFIQRPNAKATLTFAPTIVPVILIDEVALNKMFVYVSECADEIGWLGTATFEEESNIYTIHDVYLFKQEVHATTTEIKPEGLTQFAEELLAQPNGMEIWNNIRMWGHSHVNMGITPSGQDNQQMKEFSEIGQEWFIRLIANKKGEMKVDLFHYEKGLYFTDVPWEILDTEDPENEVDMLRAQIAEMERQLHIATTAKVTEMKVGIVAEMKEKVSKIRPVTTYARTATTHVSNNYNEKYKKDPIVSSYGRNTGYGYKPWADFPPTDEEMQLYFKDIPKYIQDEYALKKNITELTRGKGDVTGGSEDNEELDIIENRQAVYSFFNQRELQYLGLNRSVDEMEVDMASYGYQDQFSRNDLKLIYQVAQTEHDETYDKWGGIQY